MYGLVFLRLRPRTLTREIRELCVLGLTRQFVKCYYNDGPLLRRWPNFNSLSASLLLNIFLSFEVGIAHAIANFN